MPDETPAAWRFRKKPVVVEAMRFDPGEDYDAACEVMRWCGATATDDGCEIPTLEGTMTARPGDWIIRGVAGEMYPCRPDIFEATYEPAESAAGPDPAAALPRGIWARIEMPGRREHTGWITNEARFGGPAAVVRDWDGRVVAEVFPGPGCRLVRLPTPLKRPDAEPAADPWQRAIPAGSGDFDPEYEGDPLGDDDDDRRPF